MRSIDRSFDDLFRGLGALPIQFVDQKRSWQGSTMTFALNAKMGFVSTPMAGTVEVTDRDVTINANLGLLENLISGAKARESINSRVRALLK